jgi:hypothetical protein
MNQHQIGIAKTFAGLPFRTMDARRVGPYDETQVGDAAVADLDEGNGLGNRAYRSSSLTVTVTRP